MSVVFQLMVLRGCLFPWDSTCSPSCSSCLMWRLSSLSMGCRREGVRTSGIAEYRLLPGSISIRAGLCLEERRLGMEVRKPYIKSIPYEEWNDNETLDKLVDELQEGGTNVVVGSLDKLINWGRANSLWSLTFATSCCGIEFMACGCSRYDFARFGFEVTRNSPRQADLIMCAGTITHKMAPALKRLYDEMAEPKYVIAVGGCAISGGPFKSSYHVVKGIEEIVPVDVFIPGCPPRPEAIMYGMMQLQRKVKVEKFFGGANHKQTKEERELGVSNEELLARKIGDTRREPIVVTDVPQEFVEELKNSNVEELKKEATV